MRFLPRTELLTQVLPALVGQTRTAVAGAKAVRTAARKSPRGRCTIEAKSSTRKTMDRLSRGQREFVSAADQPVAAADPPTTAPITPPALAGAHDIDARGLMPPLPLLRAHSALRTMHPGEELRVITNDPGSLAEFQALAKYVTNFELVSQDAVGGAIVHLLRRRR
jgi:tRNA 2-thiouridine synthesizing protein A